MLKFIIKYSWRIVVVLSTIGGLFAFVQQMLSNDDYELTLFVKTKDKLLNAPNLTVACNETATKPLYLTKILLKNTGKRALTNDFIYKPLTIYTSHPNKIVQVKGSPSDIFYTSNSIVIKWILLNPHDIVDVLIFSTKPIQFNLSYKIKEVANIKLVDEVANPTIKQRLNDISIALIILLGMSMLMIYDSISLLRHDNKLQKIFDLSKTLETAESVNIDDFAEKLYILYKDYYDSVLFLPVKPHKLMEDIFINIPKSGNIMGNDLELLRVNIINCARHTNLYSIRAINIFAGPLLFGFCAVTIIMSLIF